MMPRMDPARFGRSIRALRVRRGWRLVDLAERCGLSRSVVGRVELGQLDRVAVGDLRAAAEALGARFELELAWRGASLDRLIDERHTDTLTNATPTSWTKSSGASEPPAGRSPSR
jgi:transcriptional regulator with XRE-family HTH domain